MMALYKHKEFLNLSDLADYLRDKGVYNFELSYEHDCIKLNDFIINLINENKLCPVFYYDGLVKDGFELDNNCFLMQGWICANKHIIKELSNNYEIDLNVKDYLKVYKLSDETANSNIGKIIECEMDNYIFMDTNRYKIELPILDDDENPIKPKNRMDILFEILEDFKNNKEQNPELELNIDDFKDKLPKTIKNDIKLTFSDLLYPKSDLDKLFDTTAQTVSIDEFQQLQTTLDNQTNEFDTLKNKYDELKKSYEDLYSGGKGMPYVYLDEAERKLLKTDKAENNQLKDINRQLLNENDSLKKDLKRCIDECSQLKIRNKLLFELSPIKADEPIQNKPPASGEQFNDGHLFDDKSNVEIASLKRNILAKTNNLIARSVKSLDLSKKLTKDDLAKFILPYSQDMALFLGELSNSKSIPKADINTIRNNHLTGLEFKGGSPSTKDKQRERIDLTFDRTKLIYTES